MWSCRIRQPGQVPLFPLQLWCLLCNLSFRSEQWKCQGSDFLPVGCLVFISVQEACGSFIPAQCTAPRNRTIVTLIIIANCCLNAFSIPSESSPRNTHDRGFIQNTTPPHTQWDSQSWADAPGLLVFLRLQHEVGELLAEKMLLDLCCGFVNIKHYF